MKYRAGIVAYRKKSDLKKNKILELLIVSSRKHPGQWVFPVGTVEQGETYEETAWRECAEESGYNVRIGEKLDSFIIDSQGVSKQFIFFSGVVKNETRQWEKDRQRRWCGADKVIELIAKPFVNTAKIAIQKFS